MGDLIEIAAPKAEKLDEPWKFRSACKLFNVKEAYGTLYFHVVLDLGFNTSKMIECKLDGVFVNDDDPRVIMYAENWAINGDPNMLEVNTRCRSEGDSRIWEVMIRRAELDIETLKVTHRASLANALIEQGLAQEICDA